MNLRYRYMHDRPATDDARIIAPGYFVNDLTVSYQSGKWTVLLQIQNLFNVKWNEAMFAETTRLKGENGAGQEGLTFTPGTPFCFKTGICYRF
ncbi:TonB dependent receptor [compost metagenome]